MAYYPPAHHLVLVGSSSTSEPTDTWLYNGTNWTFQASAAPLPWLDSAGMAYDEATGRLVLVAWAQTGPEQSAMETWTYDGTTWTLQAPTTNPPETDQFAVAYDSSTQDLVLFGGSVPGPENQGRGTLSNATWIYDGKTWAQQHLATSPPARWMASMAYDPRLQEIVLFGGSENLYTFTAVNDTWTYDGTNWTEQSLEDAPGGLTGARMAYDPALGSLVLFGGENSFATPLDGTWSYDGMTWTREPSSAMPSSRFLGSLAFDDSTNELVLFGGGGPGGDVHGFLDDTWAMATAP